MSKFVIGLFIVQLLLGGYLYSFVLGAGQKASNARATRIPDPVAVIHPMAALATVALWIIHMASGEVGFAWATFVMLLLTATGGAVMSLKTFRGAPQVDQPAAEPASVRVAEKQIPRPAIHLHGLGFLVLAVCTLLVAVGVAD